MQPLAFGLVFAGEKPRVQRLAACDASEISYASWEQLAGEILADDSLVPCEASMLLNRWLKGYAAVTLHDGAIISYIALAPVVRDAGDAPSWAMLAAGLDMERVSLPVGDIYVLTTSWTAPRWRRLGLSTPLRPPLIERHLKPGDIAIADMFGLSSPVLHRLGWQMLAWDRVPFISSCLSIDPQEFPEGSEAAWHAPQGTRRYQGPHVPIDAPDHTWDRYVYFWTSDTHAAEQLEAQVRALFRGDVHRWRSALVNAFAAPGSLWTLPFESYDSTTGEQDGAA
jgi:hypothetical protein